MKECKETHTCHSAQTQFEMDQRPQHKARYTEHDCLRQGFYCYDKAPGPKTLAGDRVDLAHTSTYNSSSRKVRTGTQAGEGPGNRSCCRSPGRVLPTDCSSWLLCFLTEARTTTPSMALSECAGLSPIYH